MKECTAVRKRSTHQAMNVPSERERHLERISAVDPLCLSLDGPTIERTVIVPCQSSPVFQFHCRRSCFASRGCRFGSR